MSNIQKLNPTELREIARGRLGLLVGSAATSADTEWRASLLNELRTRYPGNEGQKLDHIVESVLRLGGDPEQIRLMVGRAASKATPSPSLRVIARIRWSAILSLTIDRCLEDALSVRSSSQPGSPDPTVIVDLLDIAPEHTLPVYKLVGEWSRGQLVVTHSDLLRRLPHWGRAVAGFLDRVKASPILCLGLADSEALLEHVVAHFVATPSRRPTKLVFLADDPVVQSSRLLQIVPPSMIVLAEGGLREICDAVEPKAKNLQLSLPLDGSSERRRYLDLADSAALVDVVPTTADAIDGEKARLLDLLFMPDFCNWEPYIAGLDFRRDVTTRVRESVADAARNSDDSCMVVLQGRAGSGKTVVLRRAAFDLAQDGFLVVWLKRYWHSDADYLLDRLFTQLHTALGDQALVLVIDDPSRLGALELSDVVGTAQRRNVRVIFLVAVRTSEHHQFDLTKFCDVTTEHELEDEFDEGELERFCQYTVELGVVGSPQEAREVLADAGSPARDTLAVLYYLLPSTRQALALSVQDEYLRLGDAEGIEKIVEGTFRKSSKRLQDAYAMVATSFRYGAPLPIELLVAALGVSYGEWLDDVGRPGPAWGILYPDEANDLEGTCYRPRNELVARFILKVINAGTLFHDGEVEVLKRLLSACSGSGSVYREFCKAVLTPADKLEALNPTQGLALYDAAIAALPEASRSLLHHRGIWQRKRCGDLDGAIASYNDALSVASAPGGDEPPQLIHTSIAAALFQKVEDGALPLDEGKIRIMRELEQSKDVQFVNAHSIHVYARLLAQLASRHAPEAESDKLFLLNSAIAEIDRTILLLRHSRVRAERLVKDLHVLESEKDRILLEAGTQQQIDEQATRLWRDHRSQNGFALAIRKRTSELLGSANAGVHYNLAYQQWNRYVQEVGGLSALSPELAEVGLTLYYDWQVRPRSTNPKKAPGTGLQWDALEQCARAAAGAERYREDPLYMYIRGLALAHLEKWAESDLVFERIRRLRLTQSVLHLPRDYLLSAYGTPRKVQGRIKAGANESFFVADELARSWRVDRGSRWKSGEIQHAYVYFSFAGPRATLDESRVHRG